MNVSQPSVLLIRSGRHQGRMLTLPEGDVVVGRDESCRIRLGSSDVSRRHCRIRATSARIVIEDLGSRNGTYVNDVRIEGEVTLSANDIVRIGPLVLEVPGRAGASDDEIADWLSGVEDTTSPHDTTIIPGRSGEEETGKAIPPPAKERFESIAEEAADIIRRHNEMTQGRDERSDG